MKYLLFILALVLTSCINWESTCGDDICSIGESCQQDCGGEGYVTSLSWEDNSQSEDGFEIERQREDSDFTLLQRVGADSTAYIDETLQENAQYTYRVRSYRDNPPSTSQYSNTATVETGDESGGASLLQEITIRVRVAKENPTTENINIVIELAQERQARILQELQTNPNALQDELIPASVRRDMPAEALALIETPVRVDGQIQMTSFDDFEKKLSWQKYTLLAADEGIPAQYNLYAAQEEQISPGQGEVTGYMIGNAVVVESIEYQKTPVVPRALGEQKTLHILIKGQNAGSDLPTKEQVKDRLDNGPFASFIAETSYGKTWFTNDVTDWITVDGPLYNFHTETALDLHHQGIIDLADYDRVVYIVWGTGGGFSCVDLCNITDGANSYELSQSLVGMWDSSNELYVGGNMMSSFDFVMAHELGHALGVIHANALMCEGNDPATQECMHQEYGNHFDVMGSGSYALHFNAAMKEALGWIEENNIQYVTTSGTYTLKPLEQDSGIRALRIPVAGSNGVSIEYRQPIGFDTGFSHIDYVANTKGATLNQIQEGTFVATELIDLSHLRESDEVWALQEGEVYADYGQGFIIGPIIRATPEELVINITRMTPQCVRKMPVNIPNYQAYIVEKGREDLYAFTSVRSADSFSCDGRTVTVALEETVNGAQIIHAQEPVTVGLEPGATAYASLKFNISSTAPYGTYPINISITSGSTKKSREGGWIDIVNPLTTTLVRSQSVVSPGDTDVELAVFDVLAEERHPNSADGTGYYLSIVNVPVWWWNGEIPYAALKLRLEADGKISEHELVRGEFINSRIDLRNPPYMKKGDRIRVSIIANISENVAPSTQSEFRISLCEGQPPQGCYPVGPDALAGEITFTTEPELAAPTNLVAEIKKI